MTSIAVVVLDSVRKDVFDEFFGWLGGRHFDNAWSTSHYTVPVHGSLFTGRYPSETGVHAKNEHFDYPGFALAELLSEHGYDVHGISENLLLSPINDFDRGFDTFHMIGSAAQTRPNVYNWLYAIDEIPGEGSVRDALTILDCLRSDVDTRRSLEVGYRVKFGRFDGVSEARTRYRDIDTTGNTFLFLNLMEAHGPYNPPSSYQTVDCDQYGVDEGDSPLTPTTDFDDQRSCYRDCVRYLADAYSKFFRSLRRDFEYVITLSDHGELFGNHGGYQHWRGLYPELTHIPLVITGEGVDYGHSDQLASVVDVHRTILSLAGIDGDGRGQDILAPDEQSPRLTESHGLRPSRIRALEDREIPREEYASIDDPMQGIIVPPADYGYETPDGFETPDGVEPKSLREYLRNQTRELDHREAAPDDGSVDSEVRRHLEQLGYA